jgi:hypothetical protein
MTDEIRIALEPEDTIVDFAHKVAAQLFCTLRLELHAIDQASAPLLEARFGDDDASFLLLMLGSLAADMTRYAAYMAAGIYMAAGGEDEEKNRASAKNCVKALLRDQKKSTQLGLLAAELQAEKMLLATDTGKNMLDELLKKHKGGMN